ncbi:growth-regulated alpha protein [Eucyclogobius newberryi]|uniref:growth-regulated alpha protein n=1 Tax=Eucyclogobius newberryi TaxID=166745 RepID=UPI003B5A7443
MAARTVLCAAALLLCVAALHAMPRLGCRCVRTSAQPISLSSIRSIQVLPVSGYCRRTEIRITRRNRRVVCVKPDEEWVHQMLLDVQRNQSLSDSHI